MKPRPRHVNKRLEGGCPKLARLLVEYVFDKQTHEHVLRNMWTPELADDLLQNNMHTAAYMCIREKKAEATNSPADVVVQLKAAYPMLTAAFVERRETMETAGDRALLKHLAPLYDLMDAGVEHQLTEVQEPDCKQAGSVSVVGSAKIVVINRTFAWCVATVHGQPPKRIKFTHHFNSPVVSIRRDRRYGSYCYGYPRRIDAPLRHKDKASKTTLLMNPTGVKRMTALPACLDAVKGLIASYDASSG